MMTIKDDVYAVCDRLRVAGVNPTLSRVREELGTGSYSTIAPLVKQWRDGGQVVSAVQVVVPDNVDAAIKHAGQLIWQAATDLMTSELVAIKAEHAKMIMALTAERDEAMSEIVRLERNQEMLAVKIKECERLDLQAHKLQMSLDYIAQTSTAAQIKSDARIRELELMLMQPASIVEKAKVTPKPSRKVPVDLGGLK